MSYTIKIPVENIPVVEKAVAGIARRLAKYDMVPSVTFSTPHPIPVLVAGVRHEILGVGAEISGISLEDDGWHVVARIEHGDGVGVVHQYRGVEAVAEFCRANGLDVGFVIVDVETATTAVEILQDAGLATGLERVVTALRVGYGMDWGAARKTPRCQHCNNQRRRHTTFVLSRGDETVQVGSTCLKDFLPGGKALLDALNQLLQLEHECAGLTIYDRSEYPASIRLREFMAQVIAEIGENGWVSATTARNGGGVSTATAAMSRYWDGVTASSDDVARALEVIAAVRSMDPGNDYEKNLYAACAAEWVQDRWRNIAASAWVWHLRQEREKQERETPVSASNWIGEVGDRGTLHVVVDSVVAKTSDFGDGYDIVKMRAGEDELVWFTSSDHGFTAGDTQFINATVKAHKEFRGTKSTAVNRVRRVAAHSPRARLK
jgi:hypothetical protein